MKAKWLILPLLAGALAVAFLQRRELTRLEASVEHHRSLAAETSRLRQSNAALATIQIDTNELRRLQAHRLELMRLRAGIPALEAAARAPEEIEAETARLRQEAAEEQRRAETILAERQARKLSKARSEYIQGLGGLFHRIVFTGGEWPRSPAEARQVIERQDPPWLDSSLYMGSTLEDVDLLPFGPSSPILIRERNPRPLPDGKWGRYYFLVTKRSERYPEMRIKEIVRPDRSFEAYERSLNP